MKFIALRANKSQVIEEGHRTQPPNNIATDYLHNNVELLLETDSKFAGRFWVREMKVDKCTMQYFMQSFQKRTFS